MVLGLLVERGGNADGDRVEVETFPTDLRKFDLKFIHVPKTSKSLCTDLLNSVDSLKYTRISFIYIHVHVISHMMTHCVYVLKCLFLAHTHKL